MTLPTRTPEQFLDSFELWNRETSDPQFSKGISIIRTWIDIRTRSTVTQADVDTLFDQFASTDDAGSQLYDLWKHVTHWARELGLDVPPGNPWTKA